MPWIALALLALSMGDPLPKADPERDQATVSFEAKTITTWPEEPITLSEAIDQIAAQTSNRIVILGHERFPEVWQAKHKTDYKGKTFWELAPELAKTWDMRINTNGDGCLLLNYGREMRESGHRSYDPWNHDGLITPVQFQGAYALTFERSSDEIMVNLFPEPRLEHLQCDKGELIVRGKNGASARLSHKPKLLTGPVFIFDAGKAPKEIAAVSFQCSFIYPHDWRIEKLGPLADVLEKPTKRHRIGLYDFRVVSSKYATLVDKYTREKSETPGMVIGYLFGSKLTYKPDDFVLVGLAQQSAILGRPFDIDKHWAQEPAIEFHYAMDEKIHPKEFELWVRAPHELAKTTIKFSRNF